MSEAVNPVDDSISVHPKSNQSTAPSFTSSFILSSLFSLLSLFTIIFAYTTSQPSYPPGSLPPDARGGGSGSCRMSFMSPSYLHLSGFGREYTRLGAGPWGLYLYREAGWDDEAFYPDGRLALSGTPVVFVPGNAGSFRQVRSLASAASRSWWELPGVRRKGGTSPREGGRSLDFFTIDYNDDFSAFHGQTLLDQAEYLADSIRFILSLYHQESGSNVPDPTSVIVVAHSMGGIVARAAFLHPHFQAQSISTLITFATPHVSPPVSVDRNIDRVYDHINSYWRRSYGLTSSTSSPATTTEHEALQDLVLISIGGGISDVTIASESVSLASLLPLNDSHGFTVFTTAIPGVNTPIDHLAMLWCQQLMQTLAQSILSIVDVRNPKGVLTREDRVARLSERLLGNLESRPNKVGNRKVDLASLERGEEARKLGVGERLVLKEVQRTERTTFLLPIPLAKTYGSARVFSLLTSSSIGRGKDSAYEAYACSIENQNAETTDTCTPLFPSHASSLPLSAHSLISPILPAAIEDGSMGYLTIDVDQLAENTAIAVVAKPGNAWVVAEFGDREKRVQVVEKSALQLLLGGVKIEAFPARAALVSEIWIPALDTSILTLKLSVFRSECQDSTSLFAPLVRQYSPLVHETKYFPNVRLASLHTHSFGPYQSSPASPFASSGTRLQFFLDPTCLKDGANSDIAVEVSVDIWKTIGSLVMRYRMAVVVFPFAIVMLVVERQIREFNTGGPYPSFGTSLSLFTKDTLLPLLGATTILSLFQSIALGTHHSSSESVAEPGYTSIPARWISDALLGNRSAFFIGLAAFLLFACVGAVALEYLVLQGLVAGAAGVVRFLHLRGPAFLRSRTQVSEPRETLPLHRILTMIALLVLVLFFAPYQFAFLVIFLVHFFSTVRALLLAQDVSSPSTPASTKRLWDRYHYSFATLFMMMYLRVPHLQTFSRAKYRYRGYAEVDPIESKFGQVGRLQELGNFEEALVGTYVSLLPQGFSEPPSLEAIEVGLNRSSFQSWVGFRILELLGREPFAASENVSLAVAKDRLLLSHLALFTSRRTTLHRQEVREAAIRVMESSLRLLYHPQCEETVRQDIIYHLLDLAKSQREELEISLRLGRPTEIPLPILHFLFKDQHVPIILRPISPSDLRLISTPDPATEAFYGATRTAIFAPLERLKDTVYLHLASGSGPIEEKHWILAWDAIYSSQAYIDQAIRLVVGKATSRGKKFNARESDFIFWAVIFAGTIADLSFTCDCVLRNTHRSSSVSTLCDLSKSSMGRGWALISSYCELVMGMERALPRVEMWRAQKIAADLVPQAPALLPWCSDHPEAAKPLLQILTNASFSDGLAARLAVEMSKAISRGEAKVAQDAGEVETLDVFSTQDVSEEMVQAALADLNKVDNTT
ncbi:GPI inositol-deacylase, partial [Phenoliferia sp. Uapishka_3]